MSKIKVSFDDPAHGWVRLVITSDSQSIGISASYIYNSFYGLVDALCHLHKPPGTSVLGQQQETVVWMSEPAEAEMRFVRRGDLITLDILWFSDSRRSEFGQPNPEMSISGSYDEVALPFWRALRSLQSRFPAAQFEAHWQAPFPTREMALLTAALGK